MRVFNTSGPCDPEKHYTVMREALIEKGQSLVEQGRYFTIFAPRQSGKTTYFQLLFRQLVTQGYTPIWISFEGLRTLTRAEFYQALTLFLQRELANYGIHGSHAITNQIDLQIYLGEVSTQLKALVLIIDEFENIPEVVLDELMHTFRAMYQKRQYHKLQSLALVGVSTLAELVLSSASPFNIADELRIPYFTLREVQDLIGQYVAEARQPFDEEVIDAIYKNTQGQPGLVCALCHYLVTTKVPDHSQPITMAAFYPTLQHFLTERFDKNIVNIIQKARKKRILSCACSLAIMRFLLMSTSQPLPTSMHTGWLTTLMGMLIFPFRFIAKALLRLFARRSTARANIICPPRIYCASMWVTAN